MYSLDDTTKSIEPPVGIEPDASRLPVERPNHRVLDRQSRDIGFDPHWGLYTFLS